VYHKVANEALPISSNQINMKKSTLSSSITCISNDKTTYKVQTNITNPQAEIKEIKHAIWSDVNGQDDLKWYTANKNGNSYSTTFKASEYKNLGKFNIHTYMILKDGTSICLKMETLQIKTPTAKVSFGNQSTSGTVDVTVSDINSTFGAKEVMLPTWVDGKQSSTLKWYKATKQSNGTYKATVKMANHSWLAGKYVTDCYVTDTLSFQNCTGRASKNLIAPETKLDINVAANEKTASLSLSNVEPYGSIKKVMYVVWSNEKGQDDLIWYDSSKSGNAWKKTITINKHKHTGSYKVDAYVTLASGKQIGVKSGSFNIVAPTAKVSLANQNAAGDLQVTVNSFSSKSGVQEVLVAAWSKSNQSDLHWYTAKKQSNGNYIANVNPANHNYNQGSYKIDTYVKDGNGFMTCVKSSIATIKSPSVNLNISKSSNEKTVELSLSNISVYGSVKKVMFAVWSTDKGQDDLIWYDSSKSGNAWKKTITINKHKSAGNYKVDAYVTLANGQQIGAKNGSFTIEGPTAKVSIASQNSAGNAQITINDFNSKSGIQEVLVAAWSKSNQSDLHWYTAKKQSNGNYIANVNPINHGYNEGTYKIDAYVKDGNGFMTCVKSTTANLKKPTVNLGINKSSNEKTVALSLSNTGVYNNVKKVMFAVWSNDKGQDDLIWYDSSKPGDNWKKTITINKHKSTGSYKVDAYVTLANGQQIGVKSGSFTITAPKATLELKNYSSTTGNFDVSVTGVSVPSGISKVMLAVWSTANQSNLKWYSAKKINDTTYSYTVSPNNHNNLSGNYKVGLYITDGNGFQNGIAQKTIDVTAPKQYAIMGSSTVTVAQMANFYKKYKPAAASFDKFYKYGASYDGIYKKAGVNSIEEFCQIYLEECKAEGVKVEVAFVQAMLETGFLNYGNDVKPNQFNFAGIGATGNGVAGNSFDTVRIGIRAQVQHLKGYASAEKLNNPCVDPRYQYINPKGKAPFVEGLSGTWAMDPQYAVKILNYIEKLKN
ncbi:MAG TPA: GBS Bsp-like repeat-containing protein, partial [Candidatus Dorea intestinavium]|nr:GBS Bsp-like repeat-containing protein [Candidatus Dorea intestinavium]